MKTYYVPARFAFAMMVTAAAMTGCKKQDADPVTPDLRGGTAPDAGVITPPSPGNNLPAPEAPAPAPASMPEPATPSAR